MTTRVPNVVSDEDVRDRPAAPGSVVVTFTSNAAKSSATICQMRYMFERSRSVNVPGVEATVPLK